MPEQKKTFGSLIDDVIRESLNKARRLVEEDKKDEEVKLDTIIDRLNSIRSGKSFRDKEIHTSMQQYFDKLSKEERLALDAFLKGISQIMTGEIPGMQAPDPNDTPPNIKMTASDDAKTSQTRTITPGVVSGKGEQAEASDKEEKQPIEDRSPPRSVIVPKRR